MQWTLRLKYLAGYAVAVLLLGSSEVFAAQSSKHSTASPTSRPAITSTQKARLAELMHSGDIAALKKLVQQLEQEHDTSTMPAFGVSQAYLLVKSEKPLQGFTVLRSTLTNLKNLWEATPSAENGSSYAAALQVQADLHALHGQRKERDASRDQSYQIALQALGPQHLQTQWMLYLRMYDAVSAGSYPVALKLSQELQEMLPQPVDQCNEDICRSFRFQQANLAGSMGNLPLALKLSKELMPALDRDPTHAAWNVYHLISLSTRLQLSQERQHWCDRVQGMSQLSMFEQQEGITRAIAQCIASPDTDDQRFQALHRQEIQQRGIGSDGQAYLFLQQAENFSLKGRYQEAAQAATKAWAIGIARHIPHWEWVSAKVVAEVMSDQQRLPEAIYYGKQAINAQQRLLRNAQGLAPEQYEALLNNSHRLYEDMSQWLLEQQRFTEAEQTLTLAREQNYHRLVRSYSPTQQALEMTPAEQQLDALAQPLQGPLHNAWLTREHGSQALEKAISQASESLLVKFPAQAQSALQPATLSQLESGQTEVRYLPAPEHLYVVIRRGGHAEHRLRLPVAQKQLTQDIALLRQQLQQPASAPQALAHKLYQQLWQPLEDWLPPAMPTAAARQAPEVRVHLEGAMRYLPMAALHDGQHWLAESYALPQDTGVQARTSADLSQKIAVEHIAERKGWSLQGAVHSSADLPPLPNVRAEISGLEQLASERGIGHDAYQDAAFTADSLRTALKSRQVVHLASHFKLLPGNAKGSGLYLGNGQLLTLGELNDPSFHFEGLDLLTLSACETAIPSGPAEQGLPVDSLAWLAQARGARNVMASLWAVADEGTQALMQAFYSAMAQGQPHAQALRTAQMSLLASASPVTRDSTRGLGSMPATQDSETLAHPYYWGGFVLLTSAR